MEPVIRPGADWKPATPDGFTDVPYETSDGIAKITICRPEVRNAFRPAHAVRAARRVRDRA